MFYSLSNLDKKTEYSLMKRGILFVQGLLLYFLLVSCSMFLIMGVDEVVKDLGHSSIMDLFRKSNQRIEKTYSFFMVVILVPIIEELFFRLVLVPIKRNVAIFSFLLTMIIFYGGLYPKEIDLYLLKSLIMALSVAVVIYYLLNKNPRIEVVLMKNKKLITIVSVIVFGLIHIGNIKEFQWELAMFYPIFVLPQMFIGYFSAILRLKIGFIWGVLFHSTINFIGMSLM